MSDEYHPRWLVVGASLEVLSLKGGLCPPMYYPPMSMSRPLLMKLCTAIHRLTTGYARYRPRPCSFRRRVLRQAGAASAWDCWRLACLAVVVCAPPLSLVAWGVAARWGGLGRAPPTCGYAPPKNWGELPQKLLQLRDDSLEAPR